MIHHRGNQNVTQRRGGAAQTSVERPHRHQDQQPLQCNLLQDHRQQQPRQRPQTVGLQRPRKRTSLAGTSKAGDSSKSSRQKCHLVFVRNVIICTKMINLECHVFRVCD